MDTWKLQDAKARFSELVRRVRSEGPQHVTVHGRDEVVVISAEEFRRDGQKRKWRWDVHDAGEEAHGAAESVSTEPSEHLLGAVGEEYNPQHQSKNSYGSVVVRRYGFANHKVLSCGLNC